jgi:hypothetical protein
MPAPLVAAESEARPRGRQGIPRSSAHRARLTRVTAVLGDAPMAAWKLAASLAPAVGHAVQTGGRSLDLDLILGAAGVLIIVVGMVIRHETGRLCSGAEAAYPGPLD